METLAREIERQIQATPWKHCAIDDRDLERIWPLDDKDREAKIAEFAKKYGFRLRFYHKGMFTIFEKVPPLSAPNLDVPVQRPIYIILPGNQCLQRVSGMRQDILQQKGRLNRQRT